MSPQKTKTKTKPHLRWCCFSVGATDERSSEWLTNFPELTQTIDFEPREVCNSDHHAKQSQDKTMHVVMSQRVTRSGYDSAPLHTNHLLFWPPAPAPSPPTFLPCLPTTQDILVLQCPNFVYVLRHWCELTSNPRWLPMQLITPHKVLEPLTVFGSPSTCQNVV